MKFNAHGDLAAGLGQNANAKWLITEAPGPINPADPQGLNGGEWMDADTILSCRWIEGDAAHSGLVLSRRSMGWLTESPFAQAASLWCAGGGNWAATVQAGAFPSFGQFAGQPLPAMFATGHAIQDAGRDGTLLFVDVNGQAVVLWPNGVIEHLGVALERRCGEGGVILWTGHELLLYDGPGQPARRCMIQRVVNLHKPARAGDWVSYGSDDQGRLLHRFDDASQGYRLRPCHSPDMLTLGGQLFVAGSAGPAELPWELFREEPIRLGTGLVSLEPPPPSVPSFEPTDAAIGIGVFGEPSAPSLTIVKADGSVDERYPVAATTRAVFCDHRGNLAGSLALAAELEVPALYYLDAYGLTPAAVPAGFRPALFAYPRANVPVAETLAQAEADMARMQAAGRGFDVVVAGYCQFRGPGNYALTEKQVLDTLGALWPLTLRYGGQAWWTFHYGRHYQDTLVDGVSFWPSISEAVRRAREASADWRTFPGVDQTPIPPEPEVPVTPKLQNIVFRRDAERQTFLNIEDTRAHVNARATDPTDERTWIEVNVFDQPGVEHKGKFTYGNKVVLRSRQDQVCIYPEVDTPAPPPEPPATPDAEPKDLPPPLRSWAPHRTAKTIGKPPTPEPQLPEPVDERTLKADLNLAGMFDLRPGEFPNTVAFGIPATNLAVYVDEQGRASMREIGSEGTLRSRFDFRAFEVKDGKLAELTIPF